MEDARAVLGRRRGDVIGGSYLLGDVLGVGGMGVVYAATQRSLDRAVALKLPLPMLAFDPQVRRQFRAEALAGSRVNHANVVRVLDFGEAAGVPYLVMEHVVGPLLAQVVCESGPFAVTDAVDLVRQLLAGLEEAHANGIVHSDVKCDNIVVQTRRDGSIVPRLIDFGIARFVDEPHAPCPPGDRMVAGTPEYLAPELISGELPTVASDIYATGIVLYELLTGVTPFAGGSSTEIMDRQVGTPLIPASCRAPGRGITPALDDLIARALAKHASDRFVDAAAFARALAEPGLVATAQRSVGNVRPMFSTVSPTATMVVGSDHVHAEPRMREHWRAIETAVASHDDDAIVIAYLAFAGELIVQHRLAVAIIELEEGVGLLSTTTARTRGAPAWRLLLSLAALYDGIGDRAQARTAAKTAREAAVRAGSTIGRDRADQLSARLARASGPPRRAPRDLAANCKGAASRGRHRRAGRRPPAGRLRTGR